MKKRKLAVRLAAPCALAVAAVTIPSVDGSAQSGAICEVMRDGAPRYAADGTHGKVLGTMKEGEQVAATGPDRLWRVSRTDTGEPLGYMLTSDLNCTG
ncbi:hypothetical protein K378_01835 [Streptomyces sp. Amel2xB2]|uniref:SH3b domain-containing protein n=1 Tax=Streptomyces nanshensis TaxID=518642 RepID=A0A1E7L5S9_9ACTN|nr:MULTISPECIES: hypothetical protein [Streptomyces]OEV11556.1 hypothetical protein AN218_12365 [Streptomyces nanshensis]RAJ68946.1 hypothetical protein K378_01835 [Streptomyces sp. Amel2xB2]